LIAVPFHEIARLRPPFDPAGGTILIPPLHGTGKMLNEGARALRLPVAAG
jgi:hypothetical protein